MTKFVCGGKRNVSASLNQTFIGQYTVVHNLRMHWSRIRGCLRLSAL